MFGMNEKEGGIFAAIFLATVILVDVDVMNNSSHELAVVL